MALGDHAAEQRFPYPAQETYQALLAVLEAQHFNVKDTDATIRRIVASTGISLFSFGENISISVDEDGPNSCMVRIDSGVKIAANWSGAHRNQKNINDIIMGLSKALSTGAYHR